MTPVALSARSASLFSRFRKKREEQEPPVGPASEERRKCMPGEDGGLLKNEMQHLKSKTKGLTNRKAYKPPLDVEDRVERITSPHCEAGQDWRQLELTDPTLKFKVLTSLIKEFNHDVPNTTLHDIKTVSDAVEFFSTEVRLSSALEDLSSLDLPRNLHIQTEYIRFDPDNKDDPLTKGRTAFPGVNTYVTSIKYKRKYSDIITVKPKPGYTNYYEGY